MRSGTRQRPDDEVRGQRGFGLVEAIVAIMVFAVGMLAVAGLALSAGQLTAQSSFRTDQTFAADQVFGALRQADFSTVTDGTRTIQVGAHAYTVDVSVTTVSTDLKDVEAVVAGAGNVGPDTFRTTLYRPDSYPTSP